ncbi:hypothetical protein SADUNF_Sadunf05G0178900 [Salix dunnii]|uniref:Uncharacterized protein n=1 Tax=Salix dunnii TaxID=1413687 RepID=A0A835K6W0_9ROSI|nr:hypothetical protein SADUNF_Sadunf05G0178900 [Salix dunnii]
MPPPPGPYSGASTLALVARASAFSFGLVYGSVKLKILKLYGYAVSSMVVMPGGIDPLIILLSISNVAAGNVGLVLYSVASHAPPETRAPSVMIRDGGLKGMPDKSYRLLEVS